MATSLEQLVDLTFATSLGVAAFHFTDALGGAHYAHTCTDRLTGIFLDASPDRWSKMLMRRREAIDARYGKRPVRMLRAWDFLLGVNDESRMGAIRLRDTETDAYVDSSKLSVPPIAALRTLEAAADRVEDSEDAEPDKWILQLIAPGASLGGARPFHKSQSNRQARTVPTIW